MAKALVVMRRKLIEERVDFSYMLITSISYFKVVF